MAAGPGCARVVPTPKAMIGLGLIGAELGLVLPALVQQAAGTNEWWPYLIFPALGAIGGVVGGYFVEQATPNDPGAAVVLLAVGLAATVPALVATLALTAYDPAREAGSFEGDVSEEPTFEDRTETDAIQVETGEGERGGSGGGGEARSFRRRMDALLSGGPGILRFDRRRVLLGVPLVGWLPTFTRHETETLHLPPASDVYIPVVSATF